MPIANVSLKKSAASTTSHTARLATTCYCSNCCEKHGTGASRLPLIPALMQPPIAQKPHHRSGNNASGGHPTPRINCISIPFFFSYIAVVFLTNALIPIGFLVSITDGAYTLPLICWGAKILVDLLVAGKGVYTFKRADLLIMFPFWEIVQIPYTILIGLAGTLRGFTWKGRAH